MADYQKPEDIAYLDILIKSASKEAEAFFHLKHTAERADGVIPQKYRELMSIAAALTTQCSYCIEAHIKNAVDAGATREEIAETVFIAAALRAGGAVGNGLLGIEGRPVDRESLNRAIPCGSLPARLANRSAPSGLASPPLRQLSQARGLTPLGCQDRAFGHYVSLDSLTPALKRLTIRFMERREGTPSTTRNGSTMPTLSDLIHLYLDNLQRQLWIVQAGGRIRCMEELAYERESLCYWLRRINEVAEDDRQEAAFAEALVEKWEAGA